MWPVQFKMYVSIQHIFNPSGWSFFVLVESCRYKPIISIHCQFIFELDMKCLWLDFQETIFNNHKSIAVDCETSGSSSMNNAVIPWTWNTTSSKHKVGRLYSQHHQFLKANHLINNIFINPLVCFSRTSSVVPSIRHQAYPYLASVVLRIPHQYSSTF